MDKSREDLVRLHDEDWLRRQKIAGKIVSHVLRNFADTVRSKPEDLSLKQLERDALAYIRSVDCTPTFLGYHGFPGVVCLSVNQGLVHGIPTDYVLQDGDVVTMDVGVTYEGAIGDAAFTCVYGTAKSDEVIRMLKACQGALDAAVGLVEVGKHLGLIGHTISQEARRTGYGLVTLYGGHGLDYDKPHASPFVANRSQAFEGIRMQPGLAIAIEPMFVMGQDSATKVLEDGWTVEAQDVGCHFEHSITLDNTGEVHLITGHDMQVEDYV